MSRLDRPRRGAFTLVELLVSIALIAVITTAAITAVVQMLAMTRRLQALQTMDATAKTLFEKLSVELGAMHPCAAIWLTSDPATKSVELVFMHAKRSPRDFYDFKYGAGMHPVMGFTDLVWSRWYWSEAPTGTLEVSTSRTGRWTQVVGDQTRNYWQIPSGSKMPSSYASTFLLVPQLVRDTGTATAPNSPRDILNANAWQSDPAKPALKPVEKTDVGDYDDLLLNARPLLSNCSGLTIELRNRDGTGKLADGTSALAWAAPGSFIDGRDQPGLDDRPSVLRIRFTLTTVVDLKKTEVSRTYSFSCALPGLPTY
jgi:prepilin-type N-terminal cleavage/methylation domain-containing protein